MKAVGERWNVFEKVKVYCGWILDLDSWRGGVVMEDEVRKVSRSQGLMGL